MLEEAVQALSALRYRVSRVDAGSWLTEADMHSDFARVFSFPDYYGGNLDALNDCLGDVATYDYGSDPEAGGTVLVIDHIDAFAVRHGPTAHAMLEILATAGWRGLLLGHRMLWLLRTDDPDVRFAPLETTRVVWNSREWRRDMRDG